MLDRDPDLRRILKWAAGSPADVSDIGDVDEDRLLALVSEHRLAPRLLHRLRRDKPAWGRRSLMTRAWGQCQRAGEQMRRHAAALREITDACVGEGQPPPILVKGFSLYALTGETEHLRYSADMDLFGEDPARLAAILRVLGYVDVAGVEPAHHEYAVMERGPVLIEIHSYLPIQSYPPQVTPDTHIPEQHPGVWRQTPAEWRNIQLVDRDLRDYMTEGLAPEAAGLTILNPTAMSFVLCAHAFRNVIEGRGPKLSEIADVHALTQHHDFDCAHFVEMQERFGGYDVVQVTAFLEEAYLGARTLPTGSGEAAWKAGARLPQCLGFWVCWRTAEEALLPPLPGDVLARFGANEVIAAAGGPAGPCRVTGAGEEPGRVIVLTAADGWVTFEFFLSYTTESLDFLIILPRLSSDEHGYHIRFEDQMRRVFFFVNIYRGKTRHDTGCGTALLRPCEVGYELTVSLPWGAVPHPSPGGGVPIIFSVGLGEFEDSKDSVVLTDPILILPLLVRKA